MKKKTINSIICRKFDEWLKSIKSSKVSSLVKENTIVTGGSIASMLLGEKVNDYDVYFKTKETALEVAKYYAEEFNSTPSNHNTSITHHIQEVRDGENEDELLHSIDKDKIKIIVKSAGVAKVGKASDYEYFETIMDTDLQGERTDEYISEVTNTDSLNKSIAELPDYHPVFVSSVAITLKNKIQLVFRFWGNPEEIHETYDFVHCTNYWTSWNRKVILNEDALESLLSKELIFMDSKYPLSAIIRTRKFIRRGWAINAGQYVKMAFILNSINLEDPHVLEDQLIGVDIAYFHQLIQIIKAKKEKDKDFKLTSSYLSTLIDKIF